MSNSRKLCAWVRDSPKLWRLGVQPPQDVDSGWAQQQVALASGERCNHHSLWQLPTPPPQLVQLVAVAPPATIACLHTEPRGGGGDGGGDDGDDYGDNSDGVDDAADSNV